MMRRRESSPDGVQQSRRNLLKSGLGVALLAGVPGELLALGDRPASARSSRPWLDAALEVDRWIRSSRIVTDHGIAWPADPRTPSSISTDLYSGTPGILLFLLELHAATGDPALLDEACAGADWLIAQLVLPASGSTPCGLYEGLAGTSFVLQRVHDASGRPPYREAALRSLRGVHRAARTAGSGVEWSDSTDIISGSSGIGLFLLGAARSWKDEASHELAVRVGRRLVELARPDHGGLSWRMDPTFPRLMPNFSHGTAGVAYFLATLGRESGHREFLDAAAAGGRYLQAIAHREGQGCVVEHHDGDGSDLFYLGWCHGPVGTARLFHQLGRARGEPEWDGWVRRFAAGITESGIPERRTPGFWNNVSQCCGDAGVAQFFLDLHRTQGDKAYLAFSRRVTEDLMRRATRDPSGLRWVQAEHRVRPEWTIAQTGWMQGAAGIGAWLLRLDAFERGTDHLIALPDSPF
ncbi:MAG: lanthionine synthetase LanC family protein [Gemmatimonadaceae bacterium]